MARYLLKLKNPGESEIAKGVTRVFLKEKTQRKVVEMISREFFFHVDIGQERKQGLHGHQNLHMQF